MADAGTLLAVEWQVRLGAFTAVLVAMALWEAAAPRRPSEPRKGRWIANLGIVALNTGIVRLLPAAAPVAVAVGLPPHWGVLAWLGVPDPLAGAAAFLVLDLAVYGQHVLFHRVPALWRLHRMHHSDTGFDVTTGVRFHPLEIIVSLVYKSLVVAVLGAPAVAVVVFEVVLNATSMFNHGNVRIAPAVDRLLRWIVVTPDMHRVHHSVHPDETQRNFGFNLPWWDRLFGSYRDQPRDGHVAMRIGIEGLRAAGEARLDRLLMQPFVAPAGVYPHGDDGRGS